MMPSTPHKKKKSRSKKWMALLKPSNKILGITELLNLISNFLKNYLLDIQKLVSWKNTNILAHELPF